MDTDTPRLRAELDALCVEFWYLVDHHNGEGVAELFTPDGVYSIVGGRNTGRAAIADAYRRRAARGPRVSRHVHSNLRITVDSPTHARGISTLTLWAADGEPPLAIRFPIGVSDVHDVYQRDPGGAWRIVHRHVTQAFVSEEPAVLPFGPDSEVENSNEVPAP